MSAAKQEPATSWLGYAYNINGSRMVCAECGAHLQLWLECKVLPCARCCRQRLHRVALPPPLPSWGDCEKLLPTDKAFTTVTLFKYANRATTTPHWDFERMGSQP